jgi:tRNA dimethylallyltransferase
MDAAKKIDLVAIVGPTASGKSALAMEIAGQFNGEIITADSRTIYKGMDIGTAKPSKEDQTEIPHWGLDLIEPGQSYSAQRFKAYAEEKIKDIQKRGRLPILVGGTGLYIDGVLYDFKFGRAADSHQREKLEKLNIDKLQSLIRQKNLPMPENFKNKRHLIRTIERQGQGGSKGNLRPGTVLIGLALPDKELKKSIDIRAEDIFRAGIVDETKNLIEDYGKETVLKTGSYYYKICVRVLGGKMDEQTATTTFAKLDWQYARRQRTWFRRNPDINWFDNPQMALLHLKNLLST